MLMSNECPGAAYPPVSGYAEEASAPAFLQMPSEPSQRVLANVDAGNTLSIDPSHEVRSRSQMTSALAC